jgi:hypothetical protein
MSGTAIIKSVEVVYFYSSSMTKEVLIKELVGSKCTWAGELRIRLKVNRELVQEGPFIVPPIRWLNSFSKVDEFYIICDVV